MLRWAVDITSWDAHPLELQFLLDLLPPAERADCTSFRFEADRKRAVVSRLLQRAAAATALGLLFSEVEIRRTKGRKPFVANPPPRRPHAPNFNFNVSHEGNFVVLASEPVCLCGVDVAAPRQLQTSCATPIKEHLNSFRNQLTSFEALSKARGDGLEFQFDKAEFHFPAQNEATVILQGKPQPRWRFFLQSLAGGHWVSVARAPPEAIIDAFGEFRATFQQPVLSDEEMERHLNIPNPPFVMKQVQDLLPEDVRFDYEATWA